MSTLLVQVIWAHPRPDSLTATIASDVIEQLRSAGVEVDELDLYREGFDPVLRAEDEPAWGDLDKEYSAEVHAHADRARRADAVIFVFPVWWYSVPAIMKGYIDRVWNYGLFYGGGRRSGLSAARWIGLAGESADAYDKRGYGEILTHHLNVGLANLVGIDDTKTELLFDSLGDGVADREAHFASLRDQARSIVNSLTRSLRERRAPIA